MLNVKVTEEQIAYARQMVTQYNFGRRGYGDGTEERQFVGILGQTVLADLINHARPNGADGFDGGKDFIINGKKVDIKTMSRTVSVRDDFVHNLVGYQKSYPVDYYIFASYNTTNSILSICGISTKQYFFENADFFEKGALRTRSNGKTFSTFAPLYELKQTLLKPIDSIEELFQSIV